MKLELVTLVVVKNHNNKTSDPYQINVHVHVHVHDSYTVDYNWLNITRMHVNIITLK